MTVNTVQISARNIGFDPRITAAGGFTLPSYAFIPNAALHQLARGMVMSPTPGGEVSGLMSAPQFARAYPGPVQPNIYGVRLATLKQSPGG
jgi:hypothetical protein